jgi:hypothetical protein
MFFPGAGDGSFGDASTYFVNEIISSTTGDFNRDDTPDVVVYTITEEFYFFPGTATGLGEPVITSFASTDAGCVTNQRRG